MSWAPGELFFFKTHYPHNRLVGGGLFSDSARLRVSEAWEFFGEASGVASVKEMRARIDRYRRIPIGIGEDPVIGCLFVRDVRFFPGNRAADPPVQFARNIVQGKSYDLADPSVAPYFADLLQLLLGASVELDFSQPWHRPGPVLGDPRLAPYRLGQQSFKAVVLDAYHRRCAISGTHIPPVLQAAHIRPVKNGGEHRLDDGLLPRSDIHILFDRGYLGVDPATVCLSARACERTSATATSSTPKPDRSLSYPNTGSTGPGESSWNGTLTRFSSKQPRLDTEFGHVRVSAETVCENLHKTLPRNPRRCSRAIATRAASLTAT